MILNLNVGILGHVDSGKTTLAKMLSEITSTAAFDKNPQSQQRGITLDLGFSGLRVTEIPEILRGNSNYEQLLFTFVDCPGHASLIKTIIAGAQIIDLMILVLDINKGMETQTAECLIIGEITCKRMVVVLNKTDLIPETKREQAIEKMTKKINNTLSSTVFSGSPVVAVSATGSINLTGLIETLKSSAFIPNRNENLPFLFAFDHCFTIKGVGCVCTGTVLQGNLNINQDIEIPQLKLIKKVKSIQMFKKPVESAHSGDRVGLCITQFDSKLLERGTLCAQNYVKTIYAVVVRMNRIKYFKGSIKSGNKMHVTIGHETGMTKITVFSVTASNEFDMNLEYKFEPELSPEVTTEDPIYYALLEFDKPVLAYDDALVIASKLDIDVNSNTCRLAFWGKILINNSSLDKEYINTFLPKLKVFKTKERSGTIQRYVNEQELIAADLFKKETNRQIFLNMKVELSTSEIGYIESLFGQTSKVKLRFPEGLLPTTVEKLKNFKSNLEPLTVKMSFKKYIFDKNHKMVQ